MLLLLGGASPTSLAVPPGALTLSGVAPGVSDLLPVPPGALTLSGVAPGIHLGLAVPPGALGLSGAAPSLIEGLLIPPGHLTLSGVAPMAHVYLKVPPGGLRLRAGTARGGRGLILVGAYPATYELRTTNFDESDEAVIPFYDLSYTELLSDSWTATFSCPDHQPGVTYDKLRAGRLVSIYRNGDLRWAGILWSTEPQQDGNSSTLRFTAVGWYEALKYRYLLPPDKLRYSVPSSPFDMAHDVITYANAQSGLGPVYTFGFEIGRGDTHDFKAQFNWWDGSSLADIIQTICRLPYVSLDWFVDQDKAWNIIRRSEGSREPNPDLILALGVNVESVQAPEDLSDTATQVLSVAAGEGKDMLYSLTNVDPNAGLFGLMQLFDTQAQNRFGQRDQDFLDFHALNVLATQNNTQQRLTAKVKADVIDWTSTFVGDILNVDFRDPDDGYLQVEGPYRLAQRSVTLTEAGREDSSWMFDTPDRQR